MMEVGVSRIKVEEIVVPEYYRYLTITSVGRQSSTLRLCSTF